MEQTSNVRERRTMQSIVFGPAAAALCALATIASAQELPTSKPTQKPKIEPPSHISPDWKTPGTGGVVTGDKLVKARGTADVDAIVPGQKFLLAFVFQIEPGWHIYWQNSGASGAATEISVSGPTGFVIGKTLFPRPRAFTEPEGTVYGYEGETVLFVEVTAPMEPGPTGSAMFRAELDWLVCKDVCKMGNASQVITLPVSASMARPEPKKDAVVERFKSRLPRILTHGQDGAVAELKDGMLHLEIPAQGRTTAEFFPIEVPGLKYGTAEIKVESDRVLMKVPVEVNARNAGGKPIVVKGLAALGQSLDDPCFEFEFPLPAP